MGLLTGLLSVATDIVMLPVAVVVDVATLGQAGAINTVAKKLNNDAEDVLTGGDGSLL